MWRYTYMLGRQRRFLFVQICIRTKLASFLQPRYLSRVNSLRKRQISASGTAAPFAYLCLCIVTWPQNKYGNGIFKLSEIFSLQQTIAINSLPLTNNLVFLFTYHMYKYRYDKAFFECRISKFSQEENIFLFVYLVDSVYA